MLATAGRMSLASGNREQALIYLAEAADKSDSDTEPQTQLKSRTATLSQANSIARSRFCEAMPQGGEPSFSANTCCC